MTKERKKDLFVFFVGLMAVFKIRIFGTFYGSEILAYMSYLFIDWTKYRQNRKVVTLIKMAFVWLVGVILSDVYNSTPTVDALKGAFNVIFLIMLIPFVYWMIKDKPSRLLYYAWGYGIARILLFHYGGGLEAAGESLADMAIWRVYFYFAAAIAVAGWLYYIGKHIYAYILMMAFAVWSLSCVSRNIFLSMSVAVAVLYYIDRISLASPVDTMRIFRKKILGLFLTLGVALLCVNYTYEYLASNGLLGDRVYEKYMLQKYQKGGIASGRSDSAVSIVLALKSPIFGYGSYAKNKGNIADKTAEELGVDWDEDSDELLPGHSHIWGAWVYAGLGGLIYWLYVIIYLIKRFREGIMILDKKLLGYTMLIFMSNMWNILFSPFQGRLSVISLVVLFMVYEQMYKEKKLSHA